MVGVIIPPIVYMLFLVNQVVLITLTSCMPSLDHKSIFAMTFIFLLFKKYLFYYSIYLLRISCLNAVFMSFPSIQLLCVHPLQLLKFMVSYSSVIIVPYTCIHTLITMFCLIDFSVAYTSMCLGPTAWYWLITALKHPCGYGAQWWSSTQFCPQAFGGPSAFALSSYCFLLRECFPISVTWWPSAVRHSPDISFPGPLFVLSEHSQHFISELYALLYWIVRSSALSLSLCPVSGQHRTQSGSTVNTRVNRSMRKEAEWHSEAPAFHWRGEHCLRFSTKRKNQEDSRRIKDIIIHLLFLCHCPEYHSYYFFPSHLVSSLSDTQLSYKSCRNDSCVSPAFTALCQTNPQRCLDTPSSLDTALMGTLLVIYLFPAD